MGDLAHGSDDWVYVPMKETAPYLCQDVKTRQKNFLEWWNAGRWEGVDGRMAPFILNLIDRNAGTDTGVTGVASALQRLSCDGPSRDKKLDALASAAGPALSQCVGETPEPCIIWGKKEHLTDCAVAELTVGELTFQLVDYGDEVGIATDTVKSLRAANATELHQCSAIASGAGIEWCLQGRPKRMPPGSRVEMLARDLRALELRGACSLNEECGNQPRQFLSAAHDVTSYARDRDIRFFRLF